VARPVGRALKDDGRGGECVLEGELRKVDCRVGDDKASPSRNDARGRVIAVRRKCDCVEGSVIIRLSFPGSSGQAKLAQG
jgi:hypothetical protein